MSTKINVRSPFYLNLTEPVKPLPLYSCGTAFPNGADKSVFAVDNAGIITMPEPQQGNLISIASTDSGFSNNKYSTVSSDTTRTVTATIRIPEGFSNTNSVTQTCDVTAIQPGVTASVVQPTVCSGGPTLNGSISAVSLTTGGASTTIDLASKFTNETTYAVSNPQPLLVTTALSGSNLTISSNTLGGTATIYAIGRDNSYPATCEAVQSITINLSLPAGAPAFNCNTSPLTGGSIAADGTLINPSTTGDITGSTPSTSANSTGAARSVTLTFSITVPPGYPNAGATITCPKTFSQPAQSAPETYTCDIAALTGQSVSKNGSIFVGKTAQGQTVKSFTSVPWLGTTVDVITDRAIVFQVLIPTGYSGANGSATIDCSKTIQQPATAGGCVVNTTEFYITGGKQAPSDFCDTTYQTSGIVSSSSTTINGTMGTVLCKNGTPFNGNNLFYGIFTGSGVNLGVGGGDFKVINVDTTGVVLSVRVQTCQGGGAGRGSVIL